MKKRRHLTSDAQRLRKYDYPKAADSDHVPMAGFFCRRTGALDCEL
jgi:hypothetical protein